ncbi:MAG: hypothetical protein GWM90_29840, partial [Gemmatimonadetes bacterium]|nr:hypothetical protein [Gemmatimonadota bacterium]NIQ59291.1 hypothetical protein [Gemmatimonadota bacterium]NIU79475.1 hypothetical protein [Gammaproteobacteria bacterium]NIX48119.1 hypothetical protein [Gemmatimonadota bacterium]NIY12501.1 hypothetical protein [Gemmatimonadota bacterium]
PLPETRDAAPEEEAPAEPVRPAAEEDHIVVDDLGPLDLSLETEDLGLEPAPEGPEDGLDLGTLDLSLGTDEVTAEDVDVDAVLQRARELV